MTRRDDWLADDEANLHPEVARALRQPRGPRFPVPAVGPIAILALIAMCLFMVRSIVFRVTAQRPSPPAGLEQAQTPSRELATSRAPSRFDVPQDEPMMQELRAHSPPPNPTSRRPAVTHQAQTQLFGSSVRLRTAPNLNAHIIRTISAPRRLTVLSVRDGWCQVRTGTDTGWVFGAYVLGPNHVGLGPGVLRRQVHLENRATGPGHQSPGRESR